MTPPASGLDIPLADPDADIIKDIAAGDPAALSRLMQRHIVPIKRFAWHMLGDEMQAEDITQEAFLKAWKQAPTWAFGNAKFSTWLYRVTKNLCLDHLRKKRELYSDDPPDMVDDRPIASDILETNQQDASRTKTVEIAIAALPERQKVAITLFHFQNLSQNQAAEIMDMNVRAYESLLARGRKNLHTALSGYYQQTTLNSGCD